MEVGMIGLGRMGLNMAIRLARGGHKVFGWNRSEEPRQELAKEGGTGVSTFEELLQKLKSPKVLWIMLPAGQLVDDTIDKLIPQLKPGDVIVEGGNSNFKDSIRRGKKLEEKKIHFLDAGVSGGIWGLKIGYCQMVGGSPESFKIIEPLCKTLAPKDGYLHAGPVGAGHFCKMVHNGIEYGMMQAYGEGFDILRTRPLNMTSAPSRNFGTREVSCARGCSSWLRPRSKRIPTWKASAAMWRIQARDAGPFSKPSINRQPLL